MSLTEQSAFENVISLSIEEREAVSAFTSEAVLYRRHIRGEELGNITEEQHVEFAKHSALMESVARAYRLRLPCTLFAGFSSGYSVMGNLWTNHPKKLEGLTYHYGGVFSTSTSQEEAERFMNKSTFTRKVFMVIEGQPGLLGLPVAELGLGHGLEQEVIVADQPFIIQKAERHRVEESNRHRDVVVLQLKNDNNTTERAMSVAK